LAELPCLKMVIFFYQKGNGIKWNGLKRHSY
jgi:hypothetical protein